MKEKDETSSDGGEILHNKDDFYWYKRRLDAKEKYSHQHNYEPTRYPCKVISEWYDDPNGPYTYNHSFIYQQTVECECCHHKTVIWPKAPD